MGAASRSCSTKAPSPTRSRSGSARSRARRSSSAPSTSSPTLTGRSGVRRDRRRDVRPSPPMGRAGRRVRARSRSTAARARHRWSRRCRARSNAGVGGRGQGERMVVRARRGPMEGGLRLPHRRRSGMASAVARAVARRARPSPRPRHRGLRSSRVRACCTIRGRHATRTSTSCSVRLSIDEFAARWVRDESPDATIEALTLLEAQRHAMLMYTSCGWFFNDIAGLETVQVMRYAARADRICSTSSARALTSTRSSASSTRP